VRLTADQILTLALLALIAVVAPSVLIGSQGVRQLVSLRQQRGRLRTAVVVRARANDDLRGTVRKLKADPLFLEGLARRELGLVRPGDVVYRFPAPPPGHEATTK
jgi:cell division protein FtsB